MTDNYPRHLERVIRTVLKDTPVVCLLGPRQSGKTTLAQSIGDARRYISLDDRNFQQLAESDPAGLLSGLSGPVTFDEIQRAPGLLTEIKRAVDADRRPGRFLITGSANLMMLPDVADSLAGRMEVLHLNPLTEAEKDRNPGHFLKEFIRSSFRVEIRRREFSGPSIAERMVSGGYPEPLTRTPERARRWHRQYLRSLIERDVRDVARIRDFGNLSRMLELLAFRTGELLNISELGRSIGLHRQTADQYLAILERLYLIRMLPAWHNNPAHRLIKSPKVHWVDSGLAATLSDLTAEDWLEQRGRMGHLLESFVLQQLIAQAEWTDPDLRFWHFREKDGTEVDIVITKGKKTWGVEIKAASVIDTVRAGRGLIRLAELAGRYYQGGIVLYTGKDILPIDGGRHLAVPMNDLWEK